MRELSRTFKDFWLVRRSHGSSRIVVIQRGRVVECRSNHGSSRAVVIQRGRIVEYRRTLNAGAS